MPVGMIGTKLGMTRVFTDQGASIPVTVIHAPTNQVVQVKTIEKDGYAAVQLSGGKPRRSMSRTKAIRNHYEKAGVESGKSLREFRMTKEENFAKGFKIKVNLFEIGEKVDVIGTSKGKGTAGTVKRHNFAMQDATHGNSVSHRAPGSTGQCQYPGRVFKGKKMAGHMGQDQVTVKNLKVIQVDLDREFILVEGAVPGMPGGEVLIHHHRNITTEILLERSKVESNEENMIEETSSETTTEETQVAAENSKETGSEEVKASTEERQPEQKASDATETPAQSEQKS